MVTIIGNILGILLVWFIIVLFIRIYRFGKQLDSNEPEENMASDILINFTRESEKEEL